MSTVSHPSWCDRDRCNAERAPDAWGVHQSKTVQGNVDPVDLIAVDLTLWQSNSSDRTKVLIEFPGGSGEGNELTLDQCETLASNLRDLIARCGETSSCAPSGESN